ncbi:Osmotin, thaumatin-like protein [Daedalea quercina L-15889]|uniref:Osmotin, thaumatin-like protein n=1 Tax=Daedalea quercina L-15889 TaxID=1314783 RepID=A0A165LXL3_9APHY|nr:Osmotin, thaumatin-like protein [Daedalea quercina L-15889]
MPFVMNYAFFVYLLSLISFSLARTFTVENNCSYTVWPAIYTGSSGSTPDQATGWEAQPYTSVSFSVPDDWASGRIWGRTACDFSNSSTGQTCLSGSCSGGLECTAPGDTPATLAEWTLSGGSADYYDVSLVDGFNVPLAITNNVGCSVASCPVDLDAICPTALIGPTNTSGAVLGCESACDANLSGDASNSSNCCTGSYGTAATCTSSGVEYYSFFKGNCPDAYAYAYDESSGTALWTCDASLNANYTLTFCPPTDISNSTASASATGTSGAAGATTAAASPSAAQLAPAACSLKPKGSAEQPTYTSTFRNAVRRMLHAL